jgi:hypothetical protein
MGWIVRWAGTVPFLLLPLMAAAQPHARLASASGAGAPAAADIGQLDLPGLQDIPLDAAPDHSLEALAKRITLGADSQAGAATRIFAWMVLHFRYAHDRLPAPDLGNGEIPDLLSTGAGICTGFSALFAALCRASGIEVRSIAGYAKGTGYRDGQRFTAPNHMWNSLRIDGVWHLADVTWAVNAFRESEGPPEQRLGRALGAHFMVPAGRFIRTHLPEDPCWQLLADEIDLDIFEAGDSLIDVRVGQDAEGDPVGFAADIARYESLDSLDREIAYLERMIRNRWNRYREYGLGIAYFHKAQQLLRHLPVPPREAARTKREAIAYYNKSLQELAKLGRTDHGYELGLELSATIRSRLENL